MGRYPFGVELFHLLLHAGLSRRFHKIEHRLFSQITLNWRGRPLTSHQIIVDLIGATTTATGLTVRAELDTGTYPTGIKIHEASRSTPCPSSATTSTASGTTASDPTGRHADTDLDYFSAGPYARSAAPRPRSLPTTPQANHDNATGPGAPNVISPPRASIARTASPQQPARSRSQPS